MHGAIAEAALGHPSPSRHLSIHGLQDSPNLIDIEGSSPYLLDKLKGPRLGPF